MNYRECNFSQNRPSAGAKASIRQERETQLRRKPVRYIALLATILAVYAGGFIGLADAQVLNGGTRPPAQGSSITQNIVGTPIQFTFDFTANGDSLPSTSFATWDFDDGTTATGAIHVYTADTTWRIKVSHTFQAPGLYEITGEIATGPGNFIRKQTKQITVYRNPDTTLSELSLSAGPLSPIFNPATTGYTIAPLISDDVTETTISATASDSSAILQIKNADGWGVEVPGPLDRVRAIPGCSITVIIRVSNHGDPSRFILAAQTEYTVNVARLSCLPPAPPLPQPNLTALTVSAGTIFPNFDANVTDYTLMPIIADGVISTTVTAIPANIGVNAGATLGAAEVMQMDVSLNNGMRIPLLNGERTAMLQLEGCSNIISVHTLIASSGLSKTYNITVTKAGCVQGAQGPAGSQGPQGDMGPRGEKGDQGDPGVQGTKGDIGPVGAQGDRGDKGDAGRKGDPGERGLTGDAGVQGPQGIKGDRGPQGLQGETGVVGPKGDRGGQGPQGLQGAPGLQGPQGVPGTSGLQYVIGNTHTIASQTAGTATAVCPAGKRPIAGGYITEVPAGSRSSASYMQVFSSAPFGSVSWSVSGFNTDNDKSGKKDLTLIAYAICALVQ